MTPPHIISRVKAATDLVALISDYVPLLKQGTRWVGKCPFHAEDTPSFGVNVDSYWKCFGCGEGGDCFTFLMKIEGIPFHEALKRLADAAGVSLDETPVSRVAVAYAREEAALCGWYWKLRRERQMRQVYAHIETEDEDMLEIIAMPLAADAKLTIAERFALFRARVTEQERAEWRREVREEREFAEMWMSLAEHANVA